MPTPEFNINLIFIIQSFTIHGETRIQKYGFQIYQNYKNELKELNFYSDWVPYYYGPYSPALHQDLKNAIDMGYVEVNKDNTNEHKVYTLSIKGSKKYRDVIQNHSDILNNLYELMFNLQRKSLITILKDIYSAYPQYTTKSRIKDKI